jgi:hypothetical protein
MLRKNVNERYSFTDISRELKNIKFLPQTRTLQTINANDVDDTKLLIKYNRLKEKYGAIKSMKCFSGKDLVQRVDFEKEKVIVKKFFDYFEYMRSKDIYQKLMKSSLKARDHLSVLLESIDEEQILIMDYCGVSLNNELNSLLNNKEKVLLLLNVITAVP